MLSTCVQYVNNQCIVPSKKCVRLSTAQHPSMGIWAKACAQWPISTQVTRNWHTGFSTLENVNLPPLLRQLYPLSTVPIITKTK